MQIHSYKLCDGLQLGNRGNIKVLHSDNGSSFVGAQKELANVFKEMDHQKIQYFLQNIGSDYIIWHRNPPASGHMGGVWVRQIRSAWTILLSVLNTHGRSLNDESLRTLLAEAGGYIKLQTTDCQHFGRYLK